MELDGPGTVTQFCLCGYAYTPPSSLARIFERSIGCLITWEKSDNELGRGGKRADSEPLIQSNIGFRVTQTSG